MIAARVCVFALAELNPPPLFPQLTAATDRINSLREEQEKLQQENDSILQSSQKKEEVTDDLHAAPT